jgi:transposase
MSQSFKRHNIGFDIAKSVFQFHGIERKAGRSSAVSKPRYVLAFFQKLPSLIGIEACATSHRCEDSLGSVRSPG